MRKIPSGCSSIFEHLWWLIPATSTTSRVIHTLRFLVNDTIHCGIRL